MQSTSSLMYVRTIGWETNFKHQPRSGDDEIDDKKMDLDNPFSILFYIKRKLTQCSEADFHLDF